MKTDLPRSISVFTWRNSIELTLVVLRILLKLKQVFQWFLAKKIWRESQYIFTYAKKTFTENMFTSARKQTSQTHARFHSLWFIQSARPFLTLGYLRIFIFYSPIGFSEESVLLTLVYNSFSVIDFFSLNDETKQQQQTNKQSEISVHFTFTKLSN